jgi:hypothetical protein
MQRKGALMFSGGAGCLMLVALAVSRPPANPHIDPAARLQAKTEVPSQVDRILRKACFDCHSSQTRWPWYSQLPPALWMVSRDVEKARNAMNFSDWPDPLGKTNRASGLLLAVCAVLRAERMPPARYLALHPEARLSAAEVDTICSWSQTQAAHIASLRRK